MDCPICSVSSSSIILRSIRYTICGACYEGAKSMIALMNKFDPPPKDKSPASTLQTSPKGVANAVKWVKQMKEMEEELHDKLAFLGSFVDAFKDQNHTDIQVKPGNHGRPIPAHKALLAARSSIFRNILDLDGYMAPPDETLTLPEMNYEELDCFLEFLYSGHLPKEKVEKHVYALSIAADKYEIRYLQRFCENQMLRSLNKSNVLDVLEISDTCSNQRVKEAALNFIVKNMGDVVFSTSFESFALKNPHLSVQITRASFIDITNRRNNGI